MKAQRPITDDQAVELFRLRYTLRAAADNGDITPEAVKAAMHRLLQMATEGRASHLYFEHRRWQVQLGTPSEAMQSGIQS